MVLVFFAFWAINASIQKQRILFAVLLALLCMVSIRGSVTAGAVPIGLGKAYIVYHLNSL